MLFGKRFKSLEEYQPYDKSIQVYNQGALEDLEKLTTFLVSSWKQDVPRKIFNGKSIIGLKKIKLDEFDYDIACKVNKEGIVSISLGFLIAVDSFSSLVAESLQFYPFSTNKGFKYLNERFPLFLSYTFLNKIKIEEQANDKGYNPFLSCFPSLPDNHLSFNLWRMTANMILGSLILHELGHITFSHSNGKKINYNKGFELEADSYSIHKTFLDYFNYGFLKATEGLIESSDKLYYFLCNVTLSIHGLLIAWSKANHTKKELTNDLNYPEPEVRLINSICSINSAIRSNASLNDLVKKNINCEIEPKLMIYLLTYSLRNIDRALRVGRNYPLLKYSKMTVEMITDPTGLFHTRFCINNQLVKSEIKNVLTNYSKKYWFWVNQYNYQEDLNYEIWKKLVVQLYSIRKEDWISWSKVSEYNLKNNSILICVSQLYLNCIENIETENEVNQEWVANIESFIDSLFKDSNFFLK
jgi:hypothetical protein